MACSNCGHPGSHARYIKLLRCADCPKCQAEGTMEAKAAERVAAIRAHMSDEEEAELDARINAGIQEQLDKLGPAEAKRIVDEAELFHRLEREFTEDDADD